MNANVIFLHGAVAFDAQLVQALALQGERFVELITNAAKQTVLIRFMVRY